MPPREVDAGVVEDLFVDGAPYDVTFGHFLNGAEDFMFVGDTTGAIDAADAALNTSTAVSIVTVENIQLREVTVETGYSPSDNGSALGAM
jgi:hypothetical protein